MQATKSSIWHVPGVELLSQFIDYLLLEDCVPFRSSMGEITFKIRQGQEDLTVVHYDSPLSVAQAKQALLEENTSWIGALQEEGSSRRVGGDQQLKPGSSYSLALRHQPGASLIGAEDGSRLSAFLAEWDESRRKSSITSAQVSNINTEIWNTVQQTAHLTVASYEGSMSPTRTRKFPAYQWDDRYEGTQADRYLPYILLNIKVDSHQWQWVNVQGQNNFLTQASMHTLGYNFKGTRHGQCIWHSAQDRPAAAGILEDMMQQEELNNSEVQTLPKEDCDRLGIYKRQLFDPHAGAHKDQQDTSLADTIDSLSADEAAITTAQYMLDLFNQIPGVPMPERMGPRPVCPILGTNV